MGTENADRLSRIIEALARGEKPGNIAGRENVSVQVVYNASHNYKDAIAHKALTEYNRQTDTDEAVRQIMDAIAPPKGMEWRKDFAVYDAKRASSQGLWAIITQTSLRVSSGAIAALGGADKLAVGVDVERMRVAVWPHDNGYSFRTRLCTSKQLVKDLQRFLGEGQSARLAGKTVDGGVIFER